MPLSPHVPDLGAMEMLLSVARLGSLGRAAEEHGVTQIGVPTSAVVTLGVGVTLLCFATGVALVGWS